MGGKHLRASWTLRADGKSQNIRSLLRRLRDLTSSAQSRPRSSDQMHLRDVRAANVGHRLLVQQEFGSLNTAIAVEPALHHVVAQEISQGEHTHALVVSHPRTDYLAARPAKTTAEHGIVGCFIESVRAEPSHRFHAAQIEENR